MTETAEVPAASDGNRVGQNGAWEEIEDKGEDRGAYLLGGMTFTLASIRYRITEAAVANSPLRRPGDDSVVPYANVFMVEAIPVDVQGDPIVAHVCRFCGTVDPLRGRITQHLGTCPARPNRPEKPATEGAENEKRLYMPRVLRDMTIGELVDQARHVAALESRIIDLEQRLSEERRARREADKVVANLRKVFGNLLPATEQKAAG
jgi:hypothetical protein